MKNIFILSICLILISSCGGRSEQAARKTGKEIYFTETTYDFGEIDQHSDGLHTFQFKNIGDQPIVINKVRTTCGCTAPQWSNDPVEPGETGEISIRYNTALTGSFMKSSYVHSSASNSPVKLTLKGKVTEKEKGEKRQAVPDGNAPEMPAEDKPTATSRSVEKK